MARDQITKVLDLECTLQSAGEESSEWGNERGKSCHDEDMELHGLNHDSRTQQWVQNCR